MRIKEFQSYLKNKKIDYCLLLNSEKSIDHNFTYFTQIPESMAVYSLLIIPGTKKPFLQVSNLEYSIAKKYSRIKRIFKINKEPLKQLKSLVKGKKIAINKNNITLNQYRLLKKELKAKFVDISRSLLKLRSVKTEEEIKLLKKSCSFSSLIMKKTINYCNKNKTELQVKKFIEDEIKKLNLEPSFPPIVASGINSSNPHHLSTNKKLNGFTVIDLGVKYKNYCSDITRTIYIGKSDKKEIEIYNKVLDVNKESIKSKTISCSKLFINAKNKLGKYFIHGLGHGIGIEIHEFPNLKELSRDKLKENTVYTIEPGYYKGRIGVRIEDSVYVLKSKKEILTKVNKNLVIK
ncbi:aminopeptidase P family protein [Candidatus Woesearchaeota archaeon]|nr:aminopeptidase P family protein [Candidatus Woesearchaeota archaeon]